MILLDANPGVVREWREADAPPLVLQANDRRVSANMRDAFPYPYGLEDAKRFIGAALLRSPATFFAIELGGRIAGGIGYTLHEDVEKVSAEVGYWLGHEFWGRGIATAALRALSRHAFAAHDHLHRLYALPFACNPASARVLEKAGFRKEATLLEAVVKDGRILDQWVYALLRRECQRRNQGGQASP